MSASAQLSEISIRCIRGTRGARRRAWTAIMLLAGLVTLGSCRDVVVLPPELPQSAQPLTPLDMYATWWQATEDCAGVSGQMSRVRWFVVPESDSFVYRGDRYDGYWWQVHWITLASARVDDAAIVRHEMLHDLLGRGDHPAEYFQRRCAGIVACNGPCRLEQ